MAWARLCRPSSSRSRTMVSRRLGVAASRPALAAPWAQAPEWAAFQAAPGRRLSTTSSSTSQAGLPVASPRRRHTCSSSRQACRHHSSRACRRPSSRATQAALLAGQWVTAMAAAAGALAAVGAGTAGSRGAGAAATAAGRQAGAAAVDATEADCFQSKLLWYAIHNHL